MDQWPKEKQVIRNVYAGMIGREVHNIIEDFMVHSMEGVDPTPVLITDYPDEIWTERDLPYAPSRWNLILKRPVGKYGRSDVIGFYNFRSRAGRPHDYSIHNWCSVYDIKSWNSADKEFEVNVAQLLGYIEGINLDPTIPCNGRRGIQWMPAVFPAWLDVPAQYAPALAEEGIKLQITTTCIMGGEDFNVDACGLIYYRFQWDDDKHRQLQQNTGVRSDHIGQAIFRWINKATAKKDPKAYINDVDSQIVAWMEVNHDHADGFQQLVDIYYPDGQTIDPNVTSSGVVNYLYDQVKPNPWDRFWNFMKFIFGVENNECPPNSQGERSLPMCA
jgi:hypothetical protein